MMHHNLPKARGTFAKVVPVPSRGVYQFVIEVDDEQANAALEALGGLPAGGDARWVSIALLDAETPQEPPQKERRSWDQIPASEQAGILCADKRFQAWLAETERHDPRELGSDTDAAREAWAARFVRWQCGVLSRSELDTNTLAETTWNELAAQYKRETGREAEPR